MPLKPCPVYWLGQVEYLAARELQRSIAAARAEERVPDTLLLLTHPPTYTIGRRGKEEHFLTPRKELEKTGIAVHAVDRGGDITFHGPGQLVGYPIIDLNDRPGGASRYLRDIEEVLIRGLSAFGIEAGRFPGYTGVWVGGEKIAAIGIKINARRVTEHGFALNVETDPWYFSQIIPCGIRDHGVTTLKRALGHSITILEVGRLVAAAFGDVFGLRTDELHSVSAFELCREIKTLNRTASLNRAVELPATHQRSEDFKK
jgi:lipoyl(octanoyl) transferase